MQCALIYDFDGTLAKDDCAQYGLMPSLGITDITGFWGEVKKEAKDRDADEILVYLRRLVEKAVEQKKKGLFETSELRKYGTGIKLFTGVDKWFDRINRYSTDNGIALNHYIISSGLEEMISGTPIAGYFKKIYACRYVYGKDGEPVWPAVAINYTTKTQYLFRINKGIENSWDNASVNKFIEPVERPMPFSHMIYVGDGDTDIPAMKMVRYQGGYSIAVFDEEKWKNPETQGKIQKLISEERSNYVVPANYSEHSQLDVTIKGILQLMKRRESVR